LCKKFLFGHHTIAMLKEKDQHLKHLRFNRDCLVCTVQFMACDIKRTIAEAVDHPRSPSHAIGTALCGIIISPF
jgi:hypothetical protein